MQLKLSNVKAYPTVAISIILALTLCLFGIYIIVPMDWLGLSIASAYPNYIVRSISGIIMTIPGISILYCNIRYDLVTLIKSKIKTLRRSMFWMGIVYFYFCILRILIAGVFPPIFLLYLALGFISIIIWSADKYIRDQEVHK